MVLLVNILCMYIVSNAYMCVFFSDKNVFAINTRNLKKEKSKFEKLEKSKLTKKLVLVI